MYSQYELARRFASGHDEGLASNMFIAGDAIFSYGHHFPIAYRMDGCYLFNTEKYSISTSCQQGKVKRVLEDYPGKIIEIDKKVIRMAMRENVNSYEEFLAVKLKNS